MTSLSSSARGPAVADRFRAILQTPQPIVEVEQVESEMKILWTDVLGGDATDQATAAAFARFFSTAGLLHKHKPYGVKIATPFGYSLFDLHEGQGFSFQQHLKPKLEGFNILRPKPGAFAYISSLDEWQASGSDWARSWAETGDTSSHPGVTPVQAGDVIRMYEVGIVHTVIGAVLEEYASTSVDAVERLLDQNPRGVDCVPDALCDVPALLRSVHHGLPERLLSRTEDGWSARVMTAADPVIDLEAELVGRRVRIPVGPPLQIDSPEGWLTVALTASGDATMRIGDDTIELGLGSYAPIAPACSAELAAAAGQEACVVLHQVPAHLSIADW